MFNHNLNRWILAQSILNYIRNTWILAQCSIRLKSNSVQGASKAGKNMMMMMMIMMMKMMMTMTMTQMMMVMTIKPEVRHPPGWGSLPSLHGIPSEDYNHINHANCHFFNTHASFLNPKFYTVCDKYEV